MSFSMLIAAQKMKFFIKDLFSKYDQIFSFLRIWSHLLKKFLIEYFIFWAVNYVFAYIIWLSLQTSPACLTFWDIEE